jgi:hypothetical protein
VPLARAEVELPPEVDELELPEEVVADELPIDELPIDELVSLEVPAPLEAVATMREAPLLEAWPDIDEPPADVELALAAVALGVPEDGTPAVQVLATQ